MKKYEKIDLYFTTFKEWQYSPRSTGKDFLNKIMKKRERFEDDIISFKEFAFFDIDVDKIKDGMTEFKTKINVEDGKKCYIFFNFGMNQNDKSADIIAPSELPREKILMDELVSSFEKAEIDHENSNSGGKYSDEVMNPLINLFKEKENVRFFFIFLPDIGVGDKFVNLNKMVDFFEIFMQKMKDKFIVEKPVN